MGSFVSSLGNPMADQNTGTYYRQLFTSFSENFMAAWRNISDFLSKFELPAAIFPNDIFVSTMTAILALLQLKYHQDGSMNPFESHPIISALAITSLLLYGLAYSTEIRLSSHPPRYSKRFINVVRFSLLLTGCSCLASMASFLFPQSELGTFHGGWRRIRQSFIGIWRRITQCFTNRAPILPL
nr:uncharacterized protein LOC113698482 [Coffea arabica]